MSTKTPAPKRTDTNSAAYTDAVNDHIRRLVETVSQYLAAVWCADDVTPTGNPAEDARQLVELARERSPISYWPEEE